MIRTERKALPSEAMSATKVVHYAFDSWGEFVSHCETSKGLGGHSSRTSTGRDWSPHNWEESLELAKTGWYDIEKKIRKMVGDISFATSGSMLERVAFQMACQGEEYDVGALLEGVPECMYLPTSEITQGRTIYKIGVPFGALEGYSAKDFITQGATACALVQSIEQRGQTCEVVAVHRTSGWDGFGIRVDIPIMQAGDPIDIPFLAFALAHPSTFRRLVFKLMEADPRHKELGADGGSYGRTESKDMPTATWCDVQLPSVATISTWTTDKCAAWVRDAMEKL